VHQVAPDLLELARSDYETWLRYSRESEEADRLVASLLNPIQAWAETIRESFGHKELSAPARRLRCKADHAVNIDDEGAIIEEGIPCEIESIRFANSERKAALDVITQVCIEHNSKAPALANLQEGM